ncbi:MAG: histidine kinase N-terminal 7TM domain-containing protein, partial [Dehalococcoidales bacterium]|nr:histidine kinase N-terminal 7TM domain-containing protein [Dehalococcoidales bacterium]
MYEVFYQSTMVLSLIMSLTVVVLAWQRRRSPEAQALMALIILTFIWTLGFLMEANSTTLERQLFFNNIGYLGS